MSQELIVHQQPSPAMIPYSEVSQMGRVMAASKLFGIQNEQQAIALMLLCQSEDMHPAVAMRDFHIISGKPAMKADAMLSRFKAAGGRVKWHCYTDEKAEATFTAPDGDSITVDWTPERVKKAQLGGNAMHTKFPRQMLKARCISEGIRAVFPGVLSGLYAKEEFDGTEIKESNITAETSGPDLPAQQPPQLFIPPQLLAELNACQSVIDCRVWLSGARQKLGFKAGDALYQDLTDKAAHRVDEIKKAQENPAEPPPATAFDPDEIEPESLELIE